MIHIHPIFDPPLLSITAEKCNRIKVSCSDLFPPFIRFYIDYERLGLSGISSLVCVKYYSRPEGKLAAPLEKQPGIWQGSALCTLCNGS